MENLARRARIKDKLRIDQSKIRKKIQAALHKTKGTKSTSGRMLKASLDKIAVILKKIATSNDEDCTCNELAKSLKIDTNDLDVYLRH